MPIKAGKKQRWYPDKNGTLLKYGDLVWVPAFEWRFGHRKYQTILGRFLSEDDKWDGHYSRRLKVEICHDTFILIGKSDKLEIAASDCLELYEDQILEFNSIIMMEKLLKATK